LIGRRPTPDDETGWIRFYTDPRTPEDAWPAEQRTADDARASLAVAIAHWERWGFGPWTVFTRATDELIGKAGIRHVTTTARPEVELEWFTHPEHWNPGYATEIAQAAADAAFTTLELDELIAYTTPPNAASRAVMTKLHMTHDGETVEHAGL